MQMHAVTKLLQLEDVLEGYLRPVQESPSAEGVSRRQKTPAEPGSRWSCVGNRITFRDIVAVYRLLAVEACKPAIDSRALIKNCRRGSAGVVGARCVVVHIDGEVGQLRCRAFGAQPSPRIGCIHHSFVYAHAGRFARPQVRQWRR